MWLESSGHSTPINCLIRISILCSPYQATRNISLSLPFLFLCPYQEEYQVNKSSVTFQAYNFIHTGGKKILITHILINAIWQGMCILKPSLLLCLTQNFHSSQQNINLMDWGIFRATILKAFSSDRTWANTTCAIALVTRILKPPFCHQEYCFSMGLGAEMPTKGFDVNNQINNSTGAF